MAKYRSKDALLCFFNVLLMQGLQGRQMALIVAFHRVKMVMVAGLDGHDLPPVSQFRLLLGVQTIESLECDGDESGDEESDADFQCQRVPKFPGDAEFLRIASPLGPRILDLSVQLN